MRISREFFKPRVEATTLHITNRVVHYDPHFLPFNEIEKKEFRSIVQKHQVKYNIEIICMAIMSNHFHLLVHCPVKKMTPQQACDGYNAFHAHKKDFVAVDIDNQKTKVVALNSNNISEFMREIQSTFTKWFNRTRSYERSGNLWKGRFNSELVENDRYLWGCVKYIGLNPASAGYDA